VNTPLWQDWERRKRDLIEELESHLRMAVADRVARGQSYEEARREAMQEFGNLPLVADVTRERWGWLRMERLMQDLRYALRTLGRERGFTAVAVLILALGIGANVVVFSVVHTILLRPLPFFQPDRLVWIAPANTGHDLSSSTYSVDAYEDLRAMNRSYQDVTSYFAFSSPDNLKLTGRGEPQPVTDISVAGNFFQLLGVIEDVHESNVEGKIGWQMYLPVTSKLWGSNDVSLVVRSKQPVNALGTSVLTALRSLNPGQPAVEFRTLQEVVDHATSPRRFFAILVGIFAALGLILASLGIYGVISYSVTQQTQEIGIRMALGATRERVQAGVLVKTLRMALVGMGAGIVASLLVAKAIRSLLYGTQPTDVATFAGMLVLLTVVALLAGYLPARRASRIDPVTALRNL